MGLWEFLRQWPRGRLAAGVVASILVHVLVTTTILWGLKGGLEPRWVTKKGDSIMVELPRPEETASPGAPAPPSPPARPSPPAPPAARPTPPAPQRQAAPPRQAPTPPREQPAPPEERRVASAPRPEPTPPAPRAADSEPAVSESGPRAAEPAPTAPSPAEAPPRAPAPSSPAIERREGADRQVAAVPPSSPPAPPSASDVRSALRSGAGGRGQGRGGITGDPIPLDTDDPRFHEYFEQIRRRIQAKLTYPCIKSQSSYNCEYKSTLVIVHFGILKSGQLQFVESYRSSEWAIYDEYSMNAIRLAQPFPPVPPALMATLRPGTTGVPIAGHFNFTVYTSLDSILR